MKSLVCAARAALLVVCLWAGATQAAVVIGGTRVVFPAKDGEVTLRLSNQGNSPALVEAWIDDGNASSTPDKVNTPFLITPPLFRIEANKDQSLRIIATAANLPTDRESLFWLNVLEIPPKPNGQQFIGKNTLQFAIRSRLKLFYRPAEISDDSLKAPSHLTWKPVSDANGVALEVSNPTPFYITISRASVTASGTPYDIASGMVAPRASVRLAVKGLAQSPAAGSAVAFITINDFGAANTFAGAIAP
jgi:P pilus assembly chaperone PapD